MDVDQLNSEIREHFPNGLPRYINEEIFFKCKRRQLLKAKRALSEEQDDPDFNPDPNSESKEKTLNDFLPTSFLFPLMSKKVDKSDWLSKVKNETCIIKIPEEPPLDNLDKMLVKDLKEECRRRGLKMRGTKKELIEKIRQDNIDLEEESNESHPRSPKKSNMDIDKLYEILEQKDIEIAMLKNKKSKNVIKYPNHTIDPFTFTTIEKNLEKYTLKLFKKGFRGILDFILQIIIKGKERSYYCSDKARYNFKRLVDNGVEEYDASGAFLHQFLNYLKPRAKKHFGRIKESNPEFSTYQNTYRAIMGSPDKPQRISLFNKLRKAVKDYIEE